MLQLLAGSSPRAVVDTSTYDAFVVHAAADESFVQGYLLPELGLAPERVLVPGTLELGRFILGEIERGVRSSRVTIVVLSPAYMTDHWAVFGEQLAAHVGLASGVHGVLLPLLLEDCELPAHIQALVKLDFRNPAPEVWKAEADRLRRYLDQPTGPEPEIACPYPGMHAFSERDAGRFFGRDVELDDLVRRLRGGEREIYVIGGSGSGKSSLIAAGLVPRLLRGVDGLPSFVVRTLRPGERPLERLADALGVDLAAPAAAVAQWRARPAAHSSLLLVIDQLEELFAVATSEERERFLAVLHLLRDDPRCTFVFTLRADFYGAFMESTLWSAADGRISRIDLGPLRSDSLQRVIEHPARDVGVYFQPQLVSRLLEDAAREPGALPLLQETLCQLWARRRQRLLTIADYLALGDGTRTGLAFAVGEHANLVVRKLTGAQEVIALRILLRLVNFGEGRADTRRQQQRAALRCDGEAEADFDAVLQHLVDNRLVTVTGDDQRNEARVDLAHEILICAWPTLADWIRTWRDPEQHRRGLEAAAAAWRARGSSNGGLLDPVELAGAVAWRTRQAHQLGLSADLAALLAASEAAQGRVLRQQRWRHRVAFGAVAVFAIVTSTLAVVASHNADAVERERVAAERERGKAERERLDAVRQRQEVVAQRDQRNRVLAESSRFYQETGRQLLIEAERPLQALPYLVAARTATEASDATPSSSLRMLFALATRNLPTCPPLEHPSIVKSAVFSPDGTRVVTASGDAARVWDADSGKLVLPPLQHHGAVNSAAFSPDGTRVVTASWDGTARVWDIATGKPVSPPLEHHSAVNSAAFSPDGTRVVTASNDRTARVWDAASGEPVSPALAHRGDVNSAAFSPDGTRVVTASDDRTARVWDAASGKPISPPLPHDDFVRSAAFSPDGTRVVTASLDHSARVWSAASGKSVLPPLRHGDYVETAAFSPDGARIVTASYDNTARVWDAATGNPVTSPLVHRGWVRSAAFSPDGKRVVTASDDRTARVWDAVTGKPLSHPFAHDSWVASAAFSPDGGRVVTSSDDNTARVWDATTGTPPSRRLKHPGTVYSAAFSSDGTRLVTAGEDSAAQVWDAVTGKPTSPPLLHRGIVTSAAFSPDGSRVITASEDSTARVWDAATGKPLLPPLQHRATVTSAAFSPDGTRIITASGDKTTRLWDAATGKPLSSPLAHPERRAQRRVQPRRHPRRCRRRGQHRMGLGRHHRQARLAPARASGLRDERRVQPRRHPRRHGQQGQDGTYLGCRHRQAPAAAARASRRREQRRVQPRRHSRHHRQLRLDRADLGRRHGQAAIARARASRHRVQRHVQPRWRARRHGQQGPDCASLGSAARLGDPRGLARHRGPREPIRPQLRSPVDPRHNG